jgi:hypothetical protein
MVESDDMYEEGLWSNSAEDVESSGNDYIPTAPPENKELRDCTHCMRPS